MPKPTKKQYPSTKDFERELHKLVSADPSLALSIITGCFVSLTIAIVESQGADTDMEIKIDGGESRDITISAAKH